MDTVSDHQRQILDDLINRVPIKEIAQRRTVARQRVQAQIDTLRVRGLLSTDLPEDCRSKELHPQDSRTNPLPPRARLIRVYPGTDHELVIRSVLLPRSDGAELPAALPDTRSVVLSRPGYPGSISWELSRRERWAIDDTHQLYMDWSHRYYSGAPTRLPVPAIVTLTDQDLRTLTLVIAWGLGTEAILYSSPAKVAESTAE